MNNSLLKTHFNNILKKNQIFYFSKIQTFFFKYQNSFFNWFFKLLQPNNRGYFKKNYVFFKVYQVFQEIFQKNQYFYTKKKKKIKVPSDRFFEKKKMFLKVHKANEGGILCSDLIAYSLSNGAQRAVYWQINK